MIDDILNELKSDISKSHEVLKKGLTRIRTGRANPDVLDAVRVDYWGTPTPISQMATISVPEARMLMVKPWDKQNLKAIDRAIREADLGLNPQNDGEVLRLPMPALTEERRRDLTKVVRHEAENARVAIRNVRRDVMHELKEMLKEKLVSEDDDRRAQDDVQKLTDKYVAEVDHVLADKEKELMQV